MASPWDACLSATNRVFDRVAGEDFLLFPQAAPTDATGALDADARSAASASRPAVLFRAIFFDKGAQLHAHGRSMADSTTRPIVAESPMLDYAVEDLPDWSRAGDRVQRVSTGVVYGVAEDGEADLGRRRIRLVERSANGRGPR